MVRQRRRPGAQPGNSNALKHGFYSPAFSDSLRTALREAAELQSSDLEAELAAARVTLRRLLEASPDNVDAVTRLLSTITQLARAHYAMNSSEASDLERAMTDELERLREELIG